MLLRIRSGYLPKKKKELDQAQTACIRIEECRNIRTQKREGEEKKLVQERP